MADPNRFDSATPALAIAHAIGRSGYAVIERLPDGSAVEQLGRELAPHLHAAPRGHTEFLGAKTKRFGGLFKRSRVTQQMAIEPLVLAVADAVLLPYCARYQINFSGVMHLEP